MPELMKGLGVEATSAAQDQAAMKWQQFQRWGRHSLEYGSLPRKALTVAKPVTVAGLVVAGIVAVGALLRRLTSKVKR
jgi:hypothetical protein